jgi:hypothetical protein
MDRSLLVQMLAEMEPTELGALIEEVQRTQGAQVGPVMTGKPVGQTGQAPGQVMAQQQFSSGPIGNAAI